MNVFAGKRILIVQQRNWGLNIGTMLAKRLHEQGCLLAAYTHKREVDQYVRTQQEVPYQLIVNWDDIMESPEGYLDGEDISLEDICRDLGLDSIWPMIHSLRNFVLSYKHKYFYGFRQGRTDEQIIAYVKAKYKMVRTVFEEFGPDAIIAPSFVSLEHSMLRMYANRKGVEMLCFIDGKVGDYILPTFTETNDRGPFVDRLTELNQGNAVSDNADRATEFIAQYRAKPVPVFFDDAVMYRPKGLVQRLKKEILPYYWCWRWLRNPSKNRIKGFVTIDNRPPYYILRDHYAAMLSQRFAQRYAYHPLKTLGRFAFFPLQFQPEQMLDVTSPYFANQIETARQVAMSLPGDMVLAVKDHPAMLGRRPASYLKKLAAIPNIKLVDFRIPSETLLKECGILVSISSSCLVEAAFHNKTSIQLGGLHTSLMLPNVTRHDHMPSLAGAIRKALDVDTHTPEYERRLNNYVSAVYDTGYSGSYYQAWADAKTDGLDAFWSWTSDLLKPLMEKRS